MFLYKVFPLDLNGSYFWSNVLPSILQRGGYSSSKSVLITTNSPDWKKIKKIVT